MFGDEHRTRICARYDLGLIPAPTDGLAPTGRHVIYGMGVIVCVIHVYSSMLCCWAESITVLSRNNRTTLTRHVKTNIVGIKPVLIFECNTQADIYLFIDA